MTEMLPENNDQEPITEHENVEPELDEEQDPSGAEGSNDPVADLRVQRTATNALRSLRGRGSRF
jgi:hypothetical protein